MGNENLKIDGFAQSIYEISLTAKEMVGTLRILADGRKFRYAKAGATALTRGLMTHAPVPLVHADMMNKACPTASIGDTSITVTVVAPTPDTFAADYFRGGYLVINDQGVQYPIVSSSAIAAADTTCVLQLGQPLMVALSSSVHFNLTPSPWMAALQSSAINILPTGIPQITVTALYYCWLQTGGTGHCLISGTPTVGTNLVPNGTTGELSVWGAGEVLTIDPDVPIVATLTDTAVSGEAGTINLLID